MSYDRIPKDGLRGEYEGKPFEIHNYVDDNNFAKIIFKDEEGKQRRVDQIVSLLDLYGFPRNFPMRIKLDYVLVSKKDLLGRLPGIENLVEIVPQEEGIISISDGIFNSELEKLHLMKTVSPDRMVQRS